MLPNDKVDIHTRVLVDPTHTAPNGIRLLVFEGRIKALDVDLTNDQACTLVQRVEECLKYIADHNG